jgi:hypothetical protein
LRLHGKQWLGERPVVFDVRTFPLAYNEEACLDFDAVKTGDVACTLYRDTPAVVVTYLVDEVMTSWCCLYTWVLTENMINKLMIFERKIVRKIFGPTRTDDGYWRMKTNQEINDLLK